MPIALVLIVLTFATILFISNRLRADLVALMVLVTLGASGLVTQGDAFSGFSSSSVITILAAFVITGAINQTGLGRRLGTFLLHLAGHSPRRLLAVLTFSAGFLSLFMNNIAAAAVLMPIAMSAARQMRVSPTRILLPLAFATQLGGMATLLTTSNVVVSSILRNQALPSFGLLSFLPVGGPIALVGLVLLILTTPYLLPVTSDSVPSVDSEEARASLAEVYDIQRGMGMALVLPTSSLVGRSLGTSGLGQQPAITVVAIVRSSGQVVRIPKPDEELRADDRILFTPPRSEAALSALGLEMQAADGWNEWLVGPRTRLVEVVVAPRSALEGKTLRQIQFRSRYQMNVLAVWQKGQPVRDKLEDLPLQIGDALLLQGRREPIRLLASGSDLIVLSEDNLQPPQRGKEWRALILIVATLAAAATGWLPVAETLFAGGLLLILAGCLSIEEAYAAVEWRSVVLVGGMLPMGLALTKTGAADLIAKFLSTSLDSFGPWILLAGFFLVTAVLTQVIPGGSATPLVITPIAITAAQQMAADPRAFAMAVALATSTSFLTPMAHPVNALVMGPGGYQPRDYLRLGLPLLIVTFVLALWLIPYLYPLGR
jgi:di/tricarboxylate transporter